MTKNKILSGIFMLVCQTMLAGPRYEHDYHSGSGGGAVFILLIVLGLLYLFRRK